MSALVLLMMLDETPKKHDPTRWEKSIEAFEKADAAKPTPSGGTVFVGSSSIVGWKLTKHFPMRNVLNRGFGGSQLADSAHYAARLVNKHKPEVVVLYAGDNDIASGKPPTQVADDFRAFVKAVRKDLPTTKIVYISIKPSLARWKLWDKVSAANKLIAADCAREKDLVFLDVGPAMLGADGKPKAELFVKDGLHLSEQGYELWTSLVKPHLKKD